MGKLIELKNLVQKAINQGADNLEKIHKYVADLPFETLQNIDAFKGTVQKTREFTDLTIGTVYDLIRQLNKKVGDIADEMLSKMDSQK